MGKLLLLLIIAAGVALAVPSTRARVATPAVDWAYRQLVPNRIEMIASQLEFVRRRGDHLPTNAALTQWIENNTTVKPLDPWGHPYYIDVRADRFTVGSVGEDGQRNTPDDLTAVRMGETR
jgi:hypothetical protein